MSGLYHSGAKTRRSALSDRYRQRAIAVIDLAANDRQWSRAVTIQIALLMADLPRF